MGVKGLSRRIPGDTTNVTASLQHDWNEDLCPVCVFAAFRDSILPRKRA